MADGARRSKWHGGAAGREAAVPSANRGLKSLVQMPDSGVCIDYLKFSAPFVHTACVLAESELERRMLMSCEEEGAGWDWAAERIFALLLSSASPGVRLDLEPRGMRNFYGVHFRLFVGEQQCGFIAFDSKCTQRGTFCVELTGAGCAHLGAWAQLRAQLESASATLTRVDVAYDDFVGKHTLADVRCWYAAGEFDRNGRPPALGEAGYNDDSGRTLYVGKNVGNQVLCAYEKGKQLGDPDSPWVRFEGRFGHKYREIAYDILTAPAEYLAGHFKPLAFVSQLVRTMRTYTQRAESELKRAMHWCRHSYGGLLELFRRAAPNVTEFGRMVETLAKPQLPGWVGKNPHGSRYAYAAASAT